MLDRQIMQLGMLIRMHPNANWLEVAEQRLVNADDLQSELALQSAVARRKLGEQRLSPDSSFIDTPDGPLDVATWACGNAGRVLLILQAIRLGRKAAPDLVTELYRMSDEREKAAIVGALVLFGEGKTFRSLALDCGRTNSRQLFMSLAVNNPYPARYYTDHEFNQLVLKALFIDVNIENVLGLQQRSNPELSRMCEDYLEERLAAGRDVPADIWLALGPYASPEGERRLLGYASCSDRKQRYYSILALVRALPGKPDSGQELGALLETESDPLLIQLISDCLKH